MSSEISQLTSFLNLVIAELNRQSGLHLDGKNWYSNIYIYGPEIRFEVTIGKGANANVVVSVRIGTLRGNECIPMYDNLHKIVADGLRYAAEKKQLI